MIKKVLVVDDQLDSLWECADFLKSRGFVVTTCSDSNAALDLFNEERPDIVLLDVRMPGKDGLTILKEIRRRDRNVCVIMLSAYGDTQTVVSAMRLGADNFADKPLDPEKLFIIIERELARKELETELAELKTRGDGQIGGIELIVGESRAIKEIRAKVLDYANSGETVLITGESGVGKGLVAGALHYESDRRNKPFKHILLTTVPPTLFESALFGHVRGSFTGAHADKVGIIEAARDGTVFLDEIGELPSDIQGKLLLVIESGVYSKVGAESSVERTKARFIAATNVDVMEAMRAGKLREDLFFRLNQAWIHIPPLRERTEDIIPLAEYFIRIVSRSLGQEPPSLSKETMDLLCSYSWPGNVRELRNVAGRIAREGERTVLDSYRWIAGGRESTEKQSLGNLTLHEFLSEKVSTLEKEILIDALKRFRGNKRKAAKYLGIGYRTIFVKIRKYNLTDYLS